MKQVIIIRKDLNMRKGKMIAQGSHASLSSSLQVLDTSDFKEWLKSGQKKICLGVSSEDELLSLHSQACSLGLVNSLIKDQGLTEFKEPTYTALAIGPSDESDIDNVTRDLKLL